MEHSVSICGLKNWIEISIHCTWKLHAKPLLSISCPMFQITNRDKMFCLQVINTGMDLLVELDLQLGKIL